LLIYQNIRKELNSIPVIIPKDISPFEKLVDQILSAKKTNPKAETSKLEKQIDLMVYKLCDLTKEEIAIIKNSFNKD